MMDCGSNGAKFYDKIIMISSHWPNETEASYP